MGRSQALTLLTPPPNTRFQGGLSYHKCGEDGKGVVVVWLVVEVEGVVIGPGGTKFPELPYI